ncbi:MAG: DUF21 domain-containing protein, partial [candidate division KSB1 bacterium]|nr:DUF21 domain-containing protein [candidate division KSB1 bacterium]
MQVILIILSLIFSAFFSGSETAFVVASRIRLEVLVKRKIRGAKLAYDFITRPENFIITTLVGTNISIVVCSSLAAVYLEDFFTESVIIALTSTFILFFGEILPKAIFREIADRLIIHLARPLRLFLFLFYPIHLLL